MVSDVLALPNASLHVWYANGTASHEPVDGVHAGLMNLADVTCPTTPGTTCAARSRSCRRCAARLIERGVPPADIQYEVFGPDLWQADLD